MNNKKNLKREFMIKGNGLKRLIKEFAFYGKEVETLQNKINSMYANGTEEYDINKHKEYLQESENTKNQIKTKVLKSRDELQNLFNENTDEEVKETEDYKNADAILKDAYEQFKE